MADAACASKFPNCTDPSCINVNEINDEMRTSLKDNIAGETKFITETEREKWEKQLAENNPQSWEGEGGVKEKIIEAVKNDEYLTDPKYSNGGDVLNLIDSVSTSAIGVSRTDNPIDGINTKEQAFDYYYSAYQKALDENPQAMQDKLSSLSGYNSNLKNLDMNNDTHRDYLATVAATIASERQVLGGGLDDDTTTD